MQRFIDRFFNEDDGAVTVEWVVLTAAVVGLAVSGYATINSASGSLSGNTDTTLANMTVGNPQIGE